MGYRRHGHEPGYRGSGHRGPRGYPLGAKPTPTDDQPPPKDHCFQHENPTTGRVTRSPMSKRRRRPRMGPTTTKVASVTRNDRGLLSTYTHRTNYVSALIQNGIDHHKWNMETPSGGMGSDPRNIDQHSTLLQVSGISGGI